MKPIARVFLLAVVAALAGLGVPAGALAFGPLAGFGAFGPAAGQMDEPAGIDVAADGSVYVADFGNNRVDVFSPRGGFLFAFGAGVNPAGGGVCTAATGCGAAPSSEAAGALAGPDGLAVAPNGDVYVASGANNRVDVFSPRGEFRFAFGRGVNPDGTGVCAAVCKRGTGGSAAGAVDESFGLAFDPAGTVFVTEADQNRVNAFSAAGVFLYGFGKGVNPDQLAADRGVCTDLTGCQASTGESSAGDLQRPYGLAFTADGNLAIAEQGNGRVSIFTPGGRFLFAFGKTVNVQDGSDMCTLSSGCKAGRVGDQPDELHTPGGLAVGLGGRIYVASSQKGRLMEFTAAGAFSAAVSLPAPTSLGLATDCRGAIYASELAPISARVERLGEPGTPFCEPVPAAKPSNVFKLGKVRLNRKKGTATLAVTVPGAGALKLSGKGVRQVNRAAPRAAAVKLTIKLAGKAKRKLLATGKAKVRASVTFMPTGGDAATQGRALILKKALRRPSRR